MYDIDKNIFSIHERCNKKNDYLQNIIIYQEYHYCVGIVNNNESLEKKLEILKKNGISIIENEKYNDNFKELKENN